MQRVLELRIAETESRIREKLARLTPGARADLAEKISDAGL